MDPFVDLKHLLLLDGTGGTEALQRVAADPAIQFKDLRIIEAE